MSENERPSLHALDRVFICSQQRLTGNLVPLVMAAHINGFYRILRLVLVDLHPDVSGIYHVSGDRGTLGSKADDVPNSFLALLSLGLASKPID